MKAVYTTAICNLSLRLKPIWLPVCFLMLQLLVIHSQLLYGQNVVYQTLYTGSTFDARSVNQASPVGTLAGTPAVSASGGASYSIPIQIPPATNGVAPSISIDYNSQGASGVAGMGWGLTGSAITRTARTIYHDTYANGVDMSIEDRFSLEGQRLISKNGTYGADGSTYGTESENFSTVTLNGSGASVWFRVVTKDGVVMEYGNTSDSKRVADGETAVLFWRMNKIKYPDGNYIEFKYINSSNDFRLDEINYTGNADVVPVLVPYNKIKFSYKLRSDLNALEEGGNDVTCAYLLDKITVTAEGSTFKSYQFNYGWDNINSYLKEVIESGADNSILNATIFKYGDSPVEFQSGASGIVAGQTVDLFPGDFDADGFTDVLATTYQYVNFIKYHTGFKVYKRTPGSTTYTSSPTITLPSSTNYTILEKKNSALSYNFLSADFTGDGSDDVLVTNTSGSGSGRVLNNLLLYKSANNGTSFTATTIPTYTGYSYINATGNFIFPGDFDGDGVQDILTMLGSSSSNFYSHLYFGNNSTSFGTVGISGTVNFGVSTWATMDQIHVLDFNGDGKSDLMLIKNNVCEILTFDAWSARRIYFSTSFLSKDHLIYFGDFNGDSKTDLLIRASLTNNSFPWTKAISSGKTFILTAFTFQHTPDIQGDYSDDHFTISDYNGDGKMDIYHGWNYFVGGSATTSRLDMYYSKGSSGFHYLQHSFPGLLGFVGNQVYDMNGDGRSDNVNMTSYTSPFDIFHFKKDGKENLLEKVKTGLNHITEWNYKKLTSAGSFYTRGSLSAHPLNTIQSSFDCVSDLKTQNGIGAFAVHQYSYEEAKLNKTGKGFLGFKKVTVLNVSAGIKTVSEAEFNTSFFSAVPFRTSSYLNSTSALLSQSTLTNEFVDLGSKRFWYRVNSISDNKSFEGQTVATSNTYDNYGNVTVNVINNNNVETKTTTTVYGAYVTPLPNRPTSVTVSNIRTGQAAHSVVTTFGYDPLGRLISKTDFSGLSKNVVSIYEYFDLGNLKKTTITPAAMPARSTSATYDSKGRYALTNTNVLGQVSSATYDSKWGKALTLTGIDGLVTTNEYDGYGRLKKTIYPEGFSLLQSYGWDISGNSVWYVLTDYDQSGKSSLKTWYDVINREIKTQTEGFQNELITELKSYDARGNVSTATKPYKTGEPVLTTTNTYDVYNRLSSFGNSIFGTTTLSYSFGSGNLYTTTTNPANQTSVKVTDATGKTLSSSDAVGSQLFYTYGSHGNLMTVKAGNPTIVTNEYDAYGKQTKLIDLNAGTTTYNYNSLGWLTSQTGANAQTHTILYDLMGRATSRSGPEGSTTYEYYPAATGSLAPSVNQLKKVTGFAGNLTEYTYDGFGRVATIKETVDAVAHTTTYGYNVFGAITSVVYPSGFGTNHAYDVNGHATTIKNGNNSQTFYTNTGMNGQGQNTTYTLGNTKSSTNTYYYGVPTQYLTTGIQSLQMNWNYLSGNLLQRKDNVKSKTEDFTYDNLNRLLTTTIVGQPAQTVAYAFSGDITTKTDAGSYTYHATNQNTLIGVTNTSSVVPVFQQNIGYTSFMQPQTVNENGFALTYTYGSDYERIKATLVSSAGTSTRYYFSAGYEKVVVSGVERYIHNIVSPAGLIAVVEVQGAAQTPHYTYTDHLGSILTITNSSGVVEGEQNFDAWGRRRSASTWVVLAPTGANGLPASLAWMQRGYTGHEHLDNFGLINMNGRLYDPLVGRMLSPDMYVQDMLNTQDYNRYSNSKNNPLAYTDPDGNNPVVVAIIVGAVLGAYSGGTIANQGNYNPFKWDYKSGKTWGYMLGGAVVGAASAGVGYTVATSGIAFANTTAVVVGSYISSVGTALYTAGQTDVSIGIGFASYNLATGKFGYFGKKGNSFLENLGYGLGALANIQDILIGLKPGSAQIQTESVPSEGKPDLIGHFQVLDENGASLIDFGPKLEATGRFIGFSPGRNNWIEYAYGGQVADTKSIADNLHTGSIKISGLNIGRLKEISGNLKQNAGNYNFLLRSCSSVASRALAASGYFTLGGIHPYLLRASIFLREFGIRPSLSGYFLTR